MQDNIARIEKSHSEFLCKIEKHPRVATARALGVIFALEIKTDTAESYYGSLRNKLYDFFIENGIIMRPVGNIIYILPPYIISGQQLEKIYATVEAALEKIR